VKNIYTQEDAKFKATGFALLTVIAFLVSVNTFAQKGDKSVLFRKNAVFVEILGSSGYVYNLCYDRELYVQGKNKIHAAIGAQFFPKLGLLEDPLISFTPQFSYLYGNVHNLELGAGVFFNLYYGQWGLPIRVGYRYQPENSGFFFRAALTPILTDCFPVPDSDFTLHFWGGVGLGYSFRDRAIVVPE
jgi:hypothetical protein